MSCMKCHYCDRDAAYAAEKDGLKVGLCERHFRTQVESLRNWLRSGNRSTSTAPNRRSRRRGRPSADPVLWAVT